nr:hypothetical protein [Pseudomonas sp. PCH44]
MQVNLNALYDETGGSRHILTLEHPPEYPLKANQSPIYAGETWVTVLPMPYGLTQMSSCTVSCATWRQPRRRTPAP